MSEREAGDESVSTAPRGGARDELDLAVGPWVEAGLDDAMARLDVALRRVSRRGAVSFNVGDTPEPERELMAALVSIGGGSMSFSAEPGASAEQEGSRIAQILDRMLERVGATARIDTEVQGRFVASTTVGLAGDFASALAASASPANLEIHLKSLDQTLRARRAWARILLSTLQVATKIALAMGTGNPLLALPAAWRFIHSVMTEWKEQQQAA